eukprot:CAMPEP_0204273020 /NCGR_PEP_ID=MMETSP0468-20130131/22418_1 /ASSEMBLY_ACC=CAM_ASM_000383 /TAXON_ID=2969 /ORGANISM="Oxyrrhis marina" /LENGTH=266 /DNA_ID=CAMNT_0051248943 /DNA_START=18 /DNA_END=818 /DNA_ORIENTATION=+
MTVKIYAHYEDGPSESSVTVPVEVSSVDTAMWGSVKTAVIEAYAAKSGNDLPFEDYCLYNSLGCPIADKQSVALFVDEDNDFFLRPLPEGAKATSSALASSTKTKGELSYYYAHGTRSNLVGKKEQFAVQKPPEKLSVAPKAPVINRRQSPFGTDITVYTTVTNYSWEDHDDWTVKVYIPLEGVGKLPAGAVVSNFGLREFEVLIHGYNGQNLRLGSSKLHAEIDEAGCKHNVRANRVTVVLRKNKEKDTWFDLFKKKAIGDNDDP